MPSNNTENIYSTPFTEGTGNPIPATRIGYDNDDSHLTAEDVQAAIDELAGQQTTSKTPTFSINPVRYQCSKTSKLCMLNCYWASPTTGDLTITLPSDMKPDTDSFVEALGYDSAGAIVRCGITAAGTCTFAVDNSKNYSLIAFWISK